MLSKYSISSQVECKKRGSNLKDSNGRVRDVSCMETKESSLSDLGGKSIFPVFNSHEYNAIYYCKSRFCDIN